MLEVTTGGVTPPLSGRIEQTEFEPSEGTTWIIGISRLRILMAAL
ncbi:MAG: hypothetical protein ACW96X_13215 [Promethearchaeota archaeon]